MRSRLPPSGSSTFTIMQTLRENLTAETWGTKPNLWPDSHKIQNVKTDDGRSGPGSAACPQDSVRGLILTPGSHRQFHFSLFPCRLSTLGTNWPVIWRPAPSPPPPPPLCKAPLWLWHPPQKSGPSSRSEDTSEEEFGDIFKPRGHEYFHYSHKSFDFLKVEVCDDNGFNFFNSFSGLATFSKNQELWLKPQSSLWSW